MASYSDDSEYEEDDLKNCNKGYSNFERKDTTEEHYHAGPHGKEDEINTNDATTSYILDKDSDSDSNDSNKNYFKSFNDDREITVCSNKILQSLPYNLGDTNYEYDDQGGQFHNVDLSNDRKKEMSGMSQGIHHNLSDDSDKESDVDTSSNKYENISNFDTAKLCSSSPKYTKRKYETLDHNREEKVTKKKKLKKSEDSTNGGKDYGAASSTVKRKANDALSGESKIQRMMRKMGHKDGHGLGKYGQGRVEPVEASKQRGRRGFGHHVPGLEDASLKWDPKTEIIKVEEDINWVTNTYPHGLMSNELKDWIKLGPKQDTIHNETNYCREDILMNVLNSKSIFDKLDKAEMRRARTRSNPFETIRGAFFLNRAAVKMANMDKVCKFMFTNPPGLKDNELLYFADVCAGPGGFSEYVLWRKKWHAKGFGFTLKNENDFKLSEFYAGPCETFHPYYGPKEDGDVYDPSNQEAFRALIMKHTGGKGVHFMMADGGFSVEGEENIQEILSKQLYLCQCLVALMIVRTNGHFVTKLFDLFTHFSAGLIYLMYRCFDEVCIFKPNTSRPANSERYLICKGKRPDTKDVMEYLIRINKLLLERDDYTDVMQIVPLDELERDGKLVEYLRISNEDLGTKQIIGLLKIAAFCQNTTLIEAKQADMRKQCLEYWELEDQSRKAPEYLKPQNALREIVKDSTDFISNEAQKLTNSNIEDTILNQPYDWYCLPCNSGLHTEKKQNATFYIGAGRRLVYRYDKSGWTPMTDDKVELPRHTLVYAELTREYTRQAKNQYNMFSLHILDAFMIGGEDISKKHLQERHELTKKLCEALWKPVPNDCVHSRLFWYWPHDKDLTMEKVAQLIRKKCPETDSKECVNHAKH
ncbi:hypothetical protein KM043_018046 [Ampulex compressa]|nr:hypothetical protein KM043_018046 [Ampulex compressa]